MKPLDEEAIITNIIRKWDGIWSQSDLQGCAPMIAKEVVHALQTARGLRKKRKAKRKGK